MKKLSLFLIAFWTIGSGCGQNPKTTERKVGNRCEGCELMFKEMPNQIDWSTPIAPPQEPGDPIIISGTIYKQDGKTPAPNVILYVYHTDKNGVYPTTSDKGIQHGKLRGWVKTNEAGQYQFQSIRPASYPGSKAPQHIHAIIKEPNTTPYWIDDFLFADDPFVNHAVKQQQSKRGGYGIITLTKNKAGIWEGRRDIVLGLNIPNY